MECVCPGIEIHRQGAGRSNCHGPALVVGPPQTRPTEFQRPPRLVRTGRPGRYLRIRSRKAPKRWQRRRLSPSSPPSPRGKCSARKVLKNPRQQTLERHIGARYSCSGASIDNSQLWLWMINDPLLRPRQLRKLVIDDNALAAQLSSIYSKAQLPTPFGSRYAGDVLEWS